MQESWQSGYCSSYRNLCLQLTIVFKILASFVDPRQAFGPDKIIPPQVLANACVGLPTIDLNSTASHELHLRPYACARADNLLGTCYHHCPESRLPRFRTLRLWRCRSPPLRRLMVCPFSHRHRRRRFRRTDWLRADRLRLYTQ